MFDDGPLELPDRTLWFKNGALHRTDGPAVEFKDGQKFWFLNGKPVSEQDVRDCRQNIEREALELSDKLRAQGYDLTLEQDITVGHALTLKKPSDKK